MKQTKKLLALALAATCVLAMPGMVSAGTTDGGEVTSISNSAAIGGTSAFQGSLNKKVVDVILPTTTTTGLDFKTDPQGLLTQTDPENYKLGEGGVYFTNVGDSNTYSNTSDKMTVQNKSSFPVTVKPALTTTNTGSGKVALVNSANKLLNTADASLYIGVIRNGDAEDVQVCKEDGTFDLSEDLISAVSDTTGIKKNNAQVDGYVLSATADAVEYLAAPVPVGEKEDDPVYTYGITKNYTVGAKQTVSYQITAACDNNADKWKAVTGQPSLSFAWTLEETEVDGTTGKNTITWDRTGAITFTVDSTFAASIKDIGVEYSGTIYTYTGDNAFNKGNTTLATENLVSYKTGSATTITLNESAKTYLPEGATLYLITNNTGSTDTAYKTITIN